MAKKPVKAWVNDMTGCPKIEGTLEISKFSKSQYGIWIAGDPPALRSLASLILWVANIDQESRRGVPKGERSHVHLYPANDSGEFGELSQFSDPTEICRLDAKGTGDFPDRYLAPNKRKTTARRKRTKRLN